MCSLIVSSFLLVLAVAAIAEADGQDFFLYNTLPDGEVELRILYKGLTAKETTVGKR